MTQLPTVRPPSAEEALEKWHRQHRAPRMQFDATEWTCMVVTGTARGTVLRGRNKWNVTVENPELLSGGSVDPAVWAKVRVALRAAGKTPPTPGTWSPFTHQLYQ